jgi:hypothetical protein
VENDEGEPRLKMGKGALGAQNRAPLHKHGWQGHTGQAIALRR